MGDDGEGWRVKVFSNLKNFKHYAKKPHISVCPSVEPIQSVKVLIPNFRCDPDDGACIKSEGAHPEFPLRSR